MPAHVETNDQLDSRSSCTPPPPVGGSADGIRAGVGVTPGNGGVVVGTGVAVQAGTNAGVNVGVAVTSGVAVGVAVGVTTTVGVPVGSGVAVDVAVLVGVGVTVDVAVADGVGVTVGVTVGVAVGVGVGVGDWTQSTVTFTPWCPPGAGGSPISWMRTTALSPSIAPGGGSIETRTSVPSEGRSTFVGSNVNHDEISTPLFLRTVRSVSPSRSPLTDIEKVKVFPAVRHWVTSTSTKPVFPC